VTTPKRKVENRPVSPDFCYNCGSTGACKKWRGTDGCVQHPRPITLVIHEDLMRDAAIDAMTSVQRASVLRLLAALDPARFDYAVAHRFGTS
jgi:hypothetical protein